MGGSREVSTPTGCSRKRMRLRLFGCGGWIKLEHGAKTTVLSGRRSRVLVLDEATASIDNATDTILQKTIRTEFADCTEIFADCTEITVAHRIPTVMDCTMVLAICDGKIVEYDEPMNLMKREGSLFGQLVKEYWSHFQSAGSH